MHNAEYVPPTSANVTTSSPNFISGVRIQFAPAQLQTITNISNSSSISINDVKLSDLIAEHVKRKEFFYGIELAARSYGTTINKLDYSKFEPLLPLFTSLIWFGLDYWSVPHLDKVESLQLAQEIQKQTIVMPHFTCYRTDKQRLRDFLALNFTNVLALRGDQVAEGQEYGHAHELVTEMRRQRGDKISIGVGGYPDGHPDAISLEDDMQHLLEKVNAGADFIITQLCFSATALKRFIGQCRSIGIRVPIVIGIFVPDNFLLLQRITGITKVQVPDEDWQQYATLRGNATAFRQFAVNRAVALIEEIILNDRLDVYGVQFFTTNRFKCVQRVLMQLRVNNKVFSNSL